MFHAQRDATFGFVDFEDHDFDFVAQGHEFLRINVFVGPVHFGYVYQAFDALFDFNERAVVGDVGDFTEQTGILRITAAQTRPRIVAQLFDAQ